MRSLCILSLALVACIHRPSPLRLAQPTPAAFAVVIDRDTEVLKSRLSGAPEELAGRLEAALEERNVTLRALPDARREALEASRETVQRLRALDADAGEARILLLAETKVVFYELLQGRYKWTVYAKFTVARKGDLATATSVEVNLPVFLLYDHEREPEAMRAAAPGLAERAAALVDGFLRGRPEFPAEGDLVPPKSAARRPNGAIYFALIDRFANGDKANDGAVDLKDPNAFHGGDLKGLQGRLDWLQSLGIETVWLSPVFQMRTAPFFGHGAFHGYWVEDFNRIEPRFGDEQALRSLSDAVHARGMKLMLDIVLNHVAMDAPLTREHPEWFHNQGPITDWNDKTQLETHDVHGLPDLAQEKDAVYRHLLEASLRWIDSVNPDGFRLDAVKHISAAFWKRYARDLKANAPPGFWLLGEALDGEPEKLAALLKEGAFDSVFDFPLKFALTDTFCKGRPVGRVAATLDLDRLYGDAAAQLVTLLDNHDLPRVLTECGGDLQSVKDALTVLLTARGTPSLQYGTEVGLLGKEEPANRSDMQFDEGHPLRKHIADLLALRRAHPVLALGSSRTLALDETFFAQLRVLGDEAALIAINRGKEARSILGIEVPANAVRVELLKPQALPARGPRLVELTVQGAPLAAGDTLLLAGASPELGSWDPSRALALQGGSLSLPLREGAVLEYKLIVRRRDGSIAWEHGEDRFLFVSEGKGPLQVNATWRA